jgi:hypothetical protein
MAFMTNLVVGEVDERPFARGTTGKSNRRLPDRNSRWYFARRI